MGILDRLKGAFGPAPTLGGISVEATPRRRRVVAAAAPPAKPAQPTAKPLRPWRPAGARRVMTAREWEQMHGVIPWREIAAQLIWRPEQGEQLVTLVEQGDVRPLALFVDALRTDDTVGAVMDNLLSMLRLPMQWDGDEATSEALGGKPAEHDPRTGRVVRRAKAGDFWKMCPRAELREVFYDGRLAGVGLGELVPSTEAGGLPKLRHLGLHGLRIDWTGGYPALAYHSQGQVYQVRPGDGRWVVFTPYGWLGWWRKAPWRRCFTPYVSKFDARRYRLRKIGDMANTLHVILAKPQREGAERDDLATFAADYYANDGFLILETDESVESLEAKGEGWQAFDSAEDKADKALAKSLAGQSVTTDGTSGGLNNSGAIWDAIDRGIIEDMADGLADCLVRDVCAPYAADRALSSDVSMAWDVRSPAAKLAEAEAAAKVAEALGTVNQAVQPYGRRVSLDGYLESSGFGAMMPLEAVEAPAPTAPAAPSEDDGDALLEDADALEAAAIGAADGRLAWGGLPVEVEYEPGDVRRGVGPDGEPWAVRMRAGYGCIRGTRGLDGEEVDCYLGPDPHAPVAYLVTQLRPDGAADELKLVMGCESEDEATALYLAHVPEWCLGDVRPALVDDLADLLGVGSAVAGADDQPRDEDGRWTSGGGGGAGKSGDERKAKKPRHANRGKPRPTHSAPKRHESYEDDEDMRDKPLQSAQHVRRMSRVSPSQDDPPRATSAMTHKHVQHLTFDDGHDGTDEGARGAARREEAFYDITNGQISNSAAHVLAARPLKALALLSSANMMGAKGLYYSHQHRIEMAVHDMPFSPRGPGLAKADFNVVPTSVSELAANEKEQRDITLHHEIGHHIHLAGGARVNSVVLAGFERRQHDDRNARSKMKGKLKSRYTSCVSTYANANHKEWFAESYAVYAYRPETLKAVDPVAYDTVRTVLRSYGFRG